MGISMNSNTEISEKRRKWDDPIEEEGGARKKGERPGEDFRVHRDKPYVLRLP